MKGVPHGIRSALRRVAAEHRNSHRHGGILDEEALASTVMGEMAARPGHAEVWELLVEHAPWLVVLNLTQEYLRPMGRTAAQRAAGQMTYLGVLDADGSTLRKELPAITRAENRRTNIASVENTDGDLRLIAWRDAVEAEFGAFGLPEDATIADLPSYQAGGLAANPPLRRRA